MFLLSFLPAREECGSCSSPLLRDGWGEKGWRARKERCDWARIGGGGSRTRQGGVCGSAKIPLQAHAAQPGGSFKAPSPPHRLWVKEEEAVQAFATFHDLSYVYAWVCASAGQMLAFLNIKGCFLEYVWPILSWWASWERWELKCWSSGSLWLCAVHWSGPMKTQNRAKSPEARFRGEKLKNFKSRGDQELKQRAMSLLQGWKRRRQNPKRRKHLRK